MAAPTGAGQWVVGTELTIMASGGSVSSGAVAECTSDDLQAADADGAEFAVFEFDTAAGGFSGAPTAGATITILEQKINSDSADAPDPSTTYLYDKVGVLRVKPADEQQKLSLVIPVHFLGAKYWLYWKDGGAGTVSIDSGWVARLTPIYYPPA